MEQGLSCDSLTLDWNVTWKGNKNNNNMARRLPSFKEDGLVDKSASPIVP